VCGFWAFSGCVPVQPFDEAQSRDRPRRRRNRWANCGGTTGGIDFLLPGATERLIDVLRGYRIDLLVVYGFSWRLPATLLRGLPVGAINIHSSLLPKYRGPAPILWAIRNGDIEIGLTIHRMDENFDTGPVLAQQGGIALGDDVTQERLWLRMRPVLRSLLTSALERVERGDSGEPQSEVGASYAGLLEPEFFNVDWSCGAQEIHNQVRVFRFMGVGRGPVAWIGNQWLRVLETRLQPSRGIRVECADGPIWITESEPAHSINDRIL